MSIHNALDNNNTILSLWKSYSTGCSNSLVIHWYRVQQQSCHSLVMGVKQKTFCKAVHGCTYGVTESLMASLLQTYFPG